MIIKTTARQTPITLNTEYPYLGAKYLIEEDEFLIVLFYEKRTGVVVHEPRKNSGYEAGSWSSNWAENEFNPYFGTVTLTVERN